MQELAIQEPQFDVDSPLMNATTLTINNTQQHEKGVTLIRDIGALKDEIHKSCDPVCKAANIAHKEAVAQRNGFLLPLEEAENIIRVKISDWDKYLARERKKEEARLAEISQKKREKLIEKANAKIEAITSKTEDTAIQILELEGQLKKEISDLERETIEGKIEVLNIAFSESAEAAVRKQEELERQIEEAPVAPIAPQFVAPKVKGVSKIKTRIPEVVNFLALVKAVASGKVPVNILKVNDGALKKYANLVDGIIPGCSITTEFSTRIR